jgi:hypothetical protein
MDRCSVTPITIAGDVQSHPLRGWRGFIDSQDFKKPGGKARTAW